MDHVGLLSKKGIIKIIKKVAKKVKKNIDSAIDLWYS